jgi:hypothetical protein
MSCDPQQLVNDAVCVFCGMGERLQWLCLINQFCNFNPAPPDFPAVRITTNSDQLIIVQGEGVQDGGQAVRPYIQLLPGRNTIALDVFHTGPDVNLYAWLVGFPDSVMGFNDDGNAQVGSGALAYLYESDDAPIVWQCIGYPTSLSSPNFFDHTFTDLRAHTLATNWIPMVDIEIFNLPSP